MVRLTGSQKRKLRKKVQYEKQLKLCAWCFLNWPLEQMSWNGDSTLICSACQKEKEAS